MERAEQVAVVRRFLHFSVGDADGLDEVRDEVARRAAWDPEPVRRVLSAMEALIADPPADGTFAWLIAFDANTSLDDPSDSGAIEYLYEIAEAVREGLRLATGA